MTNDLPATAWTAGLNCGVCGVLVPRHGKDAPPGLCPEHLEAAAAEFWATFWKYERKQP